MGFRIRGNIDLNKVDYINNGVDLKDYNLDKNRYEVKDEDLENNEIFNVIYIGSIRLANNLKQLIEAAVLLKNEEKVQFLIYGDGEDRLLLENYCKKNKINNVRFKQKWLELKYIPYILTKSSLTF